MVVKDLKRVRFNPVVAVQEEYVFAMSVVDAGVAGRTKSRIGLVYDFELRVACVLLQNHWTIVGGTVIHTDYLVISI